MSFLLAPPKIRVTPVKIQLLPFYPRRRQIDFRATCRATRSAERESNPDLRANVDRRLMSRYIMAIIQESHAARRGCRIRASGVRVIT